MAYPSRFSLSIAAREDLIPEVATLGIKCVELTFDPPLEGRIQSLSRALGSSGVSAASMHGPFGPSCDMGSFDEESRSIALKRHKEHLQYCSSLGVKCYVIHPGFENYGYSRGAKWDNVKKVAIFPREDGTIERLWKTNASSLAELSDFASDLGVKIALETGPPNMMTPAETIQVVRMAKGKNLGVCVDTGHINVGLTVKPSDAIKEIGSLLIALHLHDNNGDGDFHLPPGKGNIDWVAVAKALREVRYEGTMNLEGGDNPDGMNWAKEGITFLGKVFA